MGSAENPHRRRFDSVAANALCAGLFFAVGLFIAHVFFPDDPGMLLGLLATGNLVGWALGSFLYKRLDPAVWPLFFHFLTRFVAIALVFTAGELWNGYTQTDDLRKLSLITLCLSTAAASVRLTARSPVVATFSFFLAVVNAVLYFLTGDTLILGAAVFCLILGGQALIPRPSTWARNADDSTHSKTLNNARA